MTEIPGRANRGTEQVARRFQRAWKDGARPRIEDYLPDVAEAQWSQVFERLLRAEYDLRREGGEESSVEEYLDRFPEHSELVKAVFGTTPPPLSAGSDQTGRQVGSRETASRSDATDALPRELADHAEYENVRVLGDGGMGVVYLAHNRLMGREEVLKVMARHIVERPGALERFAREIRAVAKLRHPNIVSAYTAFRCGGSLVFAMEYVEGLDLRRMVKARGLLTVAQSCNYVYQAALGLQHAHEEGMVHRDIKPGNLVLSHRRGKAVIKLLDFGLAKATTEENAIELRAAEASSSGEMPGYATRAGQMLGTPDFIAPEQIRDATQADIRADIYSLGCTLYYLLTGAPPFDELTLRDLLYAHMSMTPTPLNAVRQDVPVALAQVVAKMLAKDPADRFQQPAEVAEALKPFFKHGDASLKAVDLGTEAPFYRGAAHPAAAPPPAYESRKTGEPDFEVLAPANPISPAGSARAPAKRRQVDSGEPAPRGATVAAKPPPGRAAAERGQPLLRRLQSPTAIIALSACALGAITIAIVVVVARSALRTDGSNEPPTAATATNTAAPPKTIVSAAANNVAPPMVAPAQPDPTRTTAAGASQPATSAGNVAATSAAKPKARTLGFSGAATEWINQIGDMTVRLEGARLVARANSSAPECLEVTLRISNDGSKQPITYHSWSDPNIRVELSDQYHNYYARIVERVDEVKINPASAILDTLYFEPTPELAFLALLLPIPDTDKAFRIGLTDRAIQRIRLQPAQLSPLQTAQTNARDGTPPLKPAVDPRKRSAILSEYHERMADIKNRARFMTTNEATLFKRREPQLVVKALAKKHNITEDEVKSIVGR
jgi:serine/threonine protein kinase